MRREAAVLGTLVLLALPPYALGQQLEMSRVRQVNFEQLRADRLSYDGAIIVLRGSCDEHDGSTWLVETHGNEAPNAKVRLDGEEFPGECPATDDEQRWAVDIFKARHDFLGAIELERPLQMRLGRVRPDSQPSAAGSWRWPLLGGWQSLPAGDLGAESAVRPACQVPPASTLISSHGPMFLC